VNIEEIRSYIQDQCDKYGITFSLQEKPEVGTISPNGYFDEDEKILVVKKNHPEEIQILLHEYCHMTQWIDQIDLWNDLEKLEMEFDVWLDKKVEYSPEVVAKDIDHLVALEKDCEERVLKLIEDFSLHDIVNTKIYVQKALAYLSFYYTLPTIRRWYVTAPYDIEEIYSLMPTTIPKTLDEIKDLANLPIPWHLTKRK